MKKLLLIAASFGVVAVGSMLKGLNCVCDNGSSVKDKGGCAKSCKSIGSNWSGAAGVTACQSAIQARDTLASTIIANDQRYQQALQDFQAGMNSLNSSALGQQVKTIYDNAPEITSADPQLQQALQQYLNQPSNKAILDQLHGQQAAIETKLDAAKAAVQARVDQNPSYQAAVQKVSQTC